MTEEGRKDDDGLARWDLLPVGPLRKIVEVYTIGAKKYEDHNWRKGLRYGRVFAAMMRHAWAWLDGEQLDPKDGQHHLAAVAWNAMTLMELEETHPELDDRWNGAHDLRMSIRYDYELRDRASQRAKMLAEIDLCDADD